MFQLCADKGKCESPTKSRKRVLVDNEGEEDSKLKRERTDSPVTSDSASVADDADSAEPNPLDLAESLDDPLPPPKEVPPSSPLSDNSQQPVFKLDECNVVFNIAVPKKEPVDPTDSVKEEHTSESSFGATSQLHPSPPVIKEEVKVPNIPDIKPKLENTFFSISVLSDRVVDPPSSGPLPKAFDEIPMPSKLSIKREALFEPAQSTESVIVPIIPNSVDSFVPKEEISPSSPPMLHSAELRTVPTQSQVVNTIKTESSEDSVSSEPSANLQPSSPSDLTAPSLSPLPLTAYAPASPHLLPPEHADEKSGIIVPAFSVSSEEKPTLNIPTVQASLSASSHHSNFTNFYHPHFHPHPSKLNPSPPSYLGSNLQNEPQNLKIKQEVIPPDSIQPSQDPLQSLKEVKVPGYNASSISQPLLPTSITNQVDLSSTSQTTSPFQSVGPCVDNIKKEPESFHPVRTNTPSKSPTVKPLDASLIPSPAQRSSSTHTPPFPPPPPPVSHSAANLIAPSPTTVNPPTSLPQTVMHPSQQPSPLSRVSPGHLAHPHAFVPAMHHPHHLIHHPLFAAVAASAVHHSPYHPHHPYAGYPYPFTYGHYPPIPQPVPPPSHPRDQKRESLETTLMTSHHSSVTTRSLREVETREETQEITQTHHHSTSHHSSVHHHSGGEKQPLTISHSTTSSSSVQHKINSKRGTSPAATQVNLSSNLLIKVQAIFKRGWFSMQNYHI